MKKIIHYVPVRLDDQTLEMLQALVKQSGKKSRGAVIRKVIQEAYSKTAITGKP